MVVNMLQQSLNKLLRTSRAQQKLSPTRVIVGSFLFVILLGTLLLLMPFASKDGQSIGIIGALFTATSATCVTGLVVFDTYTKFSLFGQLVILLLIQIGGLGLVTLTTFVSIAVGRRLGFKSIKLASESINLSDQSKAKTLLKIVMGVAFTAEAIGTVLLSLALVPQFGLKGIYYSFFISVSAFCNAGFDIFGHMGEYNSLVGFSSNPYILIVIALLIISGGLGFLVWQDIINYKNTKHLRLHTKLVFLMTISLIILGTIVFSLLEWNNTATLGEFNTFDKIINSFFQSVTTRTAGFNSVDLASTSSFTKLFMTMFMFIGAAPGGTGGGIKITTISVLLVAVLSVITGREEAQVFNRRISQKVVYKSLAIFMLSILAVFVSSITLYFFTTSQSDAVNSLFEAVSAFATVGLSVGVTSSMTPFAQFITMVTMLVGRVGPITMAISLSIKGNSSKNSHIILPQADITVG